MSALPSKADMTERDWDVCFVPLAKSGHCGAAVGCPLCADFVAEVGGDTRVAVVTNFLK
jgi:hypothetical protein